MKKMMTLLRREFWENKGAFRTTPIVLGAISIVGFLMAIFTVSYFDNDFQTLKEAIRFIANQDPELRGLILYEGLLGSSLLFTFGLGVVVFFYLLGSLYDDRKDRSILWWKSLPASDTQTLISKLLSAMLVAPLIFWAVYVVTMLIMGLISTIVVLALGENPWTLFISISNPFKAWSLLLASYLAQAVWALPLYGWLMLVSSFAPRIPLLFAVLPPVVFAVLQIWIKFLQTFTFRDNLFGLIGSWWANSPLVLSFDVNDEGPGAALGLPISDDFDHAVSFANILARMFSTDMAIYLVVAAAFLAAALWLRQRATDS